MSIGIFDIEINSIEFYERKHTTILKFGGVICYFNSRQEVENFLMALDNAVNSDEEE